MYLGYQNNKIVLIANTRKELQNTPCMKFDRIVESQEEYVLYNGEYLTPEQVAVKEKQARRVSLIAQLDTLDLKCIRSLRAIQSGAGTEADITKLAEYETQAEAIRQELRNL